MASLNHTHNTYNSSRVATAEQADNQLPQEQVLWKLLILTALAYLIWSDKISIVFGPVTAGELVGQTDGDRVRAAIFDYSTQPQKGRKNLTEVEVALPPGALNNVTFAIDPAFARRNKVATSEMKSRLTKCRNYVAKYADAAITEMQKTGIPASIMLAQGLLESDAGENKLARTTNNHFSIKCYSKRCKRGHCSNFTDDSHKDFFVKYADVAGSFRGHSQLLKKSSRYRHLFDLDGTDYRSWARGLAGAGYSTDKQYGEKIIAIIQTLGLDRHDSGA